MKSCIKAFNLGLITVIIFFVSAASSLYAADITLSWDPNCNDIPDLIGYNIYYKANSSVLADPQSADVIYIPLTDADFDAESPSYQITDLIDSVRYYFTVTAMYATDGNQDEESAMSNEVAVGGNGDNASISGNSNNDSAGGCFISDLF